jgi:hypothetical protein
MDCSRIREQIVGVLEDCAADGDMRDVEQHLRQCAECRAEVRQLEELRGRLSVLSAAMPGTDLRDRVMERLAVERREPNSVTGLRRMAGRWTGLKSNRRLRLAAAGLVMFALVLVGWVLVVPPAPAWAIEQSIQVMSGFRGVYLSGVMNGNQNLEMWLRSGPDPSQVRDLLARIGDLTLWAKHNKTYYHQRGSAVVYVDDGLTAGIYPWPGAELLELVRAAGFHEVSRGRDPVTGHQRIAIETSLTTVNGLQSSILEFDATTKMLVSIRQWPNLDRAGKPSFEASKIVYFEDLGDDVFTVDLPRGLEQRPKEVTVPEELLALLASPAAGIPAAGVSKNEAARRIVSELWEAVGDADWPRFRTLVPLTSGWTDNVLSAYILGVDGRNALDEVIEIGDASVRGRSRLGPLVVVPTRIRHRDGKIYEEKFIVQFRGPSESPSCVIYAPYGTPYQLP